MAFDGIVIANLTKDLKEKLEGGKINKIAQPEKDELLFTIKNNRETLRLLMSASASLPLIYFTEKNKTSPLTAPGFCMLLRKHIGTGRILSVSQPGLERIIEFQIEHLDEMGDLCRKRLIVELMGKHSNIIFCKEDGTILDSIKHVSSQMSSVREVLPGRTYFIPRTVEKGDPLHISANELSHGELTHLHRTLSLMMEDVSSGNFSPNIVYRRGEPVEFSSLPLTCFEGGDYRPRTFDSISLLLEDYYAQKNTITRIRQKSADLRRIVQTALERNYKKYDLQLKQLKDTEKRDKYKVYGELLNTYGYELQGGEKQLTCLNYNTGQEITIPLDPTLTARENSQKFFDKYNKLKRTFEALTGLIQETRDEIDHLESIGTSLDIALKEEDLVQIKEELTEYGYIRRHYVKGKKPRITSKPFHYISSDGFHIYVGKNNYQNEELTFKAATGNDWWFHAKGIPGSHVIVKCEGKELPDRVFEEAGALAAYYSKGRGSDKVEIDYVQKKHVKKAAKGAPGFVIYHTKKPQARPPALSSITPTTPSWPSRGNFPGWRSKKSNLPKSCT